MSSKMTVPRICEYCKSDFFGRTTRTKYCSHKCNQRHYKQKTRNKKIEKSNNEVLAIKLQPLEMIKAKEYLTVREVSVILNCSLRTTYNYVKNGTIKGVNLSQRMTRIRRKEIDKLFETEQY